jgi:hypothetical protein
VLVFDGSPNLPLCEPNVPGHRADHPTDQPQRRESARRDLSWGAAHQVPEGSPTLLHQCRWRWSPANHLPARMIRDLGKRLSELGGARGRQVRILDRIQTCGGDAGDFTRRTGVSLRVTSHPRTAQCAAVTRGQPEAPAATPFRTPSHTRWWTRHLRRVPAGRPPRAAKTPSPGPTMARAAP